MQPAVEPRPRLIECRPRGLLATRTGVRMNLRGVIFDLDGTLGDTLPVCYAAYREVFEGYLGKTYRDEEIAALFGPNEGSSAICSRAVWLCEIPSRLSPCGRSPSRIGQLWRGCLSAALPRRWKTPLCCRTTRSPTPASMAIAWWLRKAGGAGTGLWISGFSATPPTEAGVSRQLLCRRCPRRPPGKTPLPNTGATKPTWF